MASVDMKSLLVASGLCNSRTLANRLIKDKAVSVDGDAVGLRAYVPTTMPFILRAGRHFKKVRLV